MNALLIRLRAALDDQIRAWEVLSAREQPWLADPTITRTDGASDVHARRQPSSSRPTARTTSASRFV